jgi:pyridoxal phosphate-dependent aminotransferase EpsN
MSTLRKIYPSVRSTQRILLSIPHMGGMERQYVEEAFTSNWLSTSGPNIAKLESAFSALVGLPSLALNSGTAGIHLGLKLLDLKLGQEIVVPTLTFVASCNPVLYEGGRPIFIDSERKSWNLDPQLLAAFLEKRAASNRLPKAVIVVHLFGQSADLAPIKQICERYELPILEDAAESLGAKYEGKLVGAFGDVGVYSLNGNKIITSAGGGLLVSPHRDWIERARSWSNQACDPGVDYLHSQVGYNYRLSNVLAGIAVGQLGVLSERISQRRAIAFRYRDEFADIPGLEFMPESCTNFHIHWLSCFLVDPRRFGMAQSDLIQFLDAANIQARPVWKPMHTQKLYERCECVGGTVAEDLNKRGICLPSSSNLKLEDQQFVIDRVREAHFRSRIQP